MLTISLLFYVCFLKEESTYWDGLKACLEGDDVFLIFLNFSSSSWLFDFDSPGVNIGVLFSSLRRLLSSFSNAWIFWCLLLLFKLKMLSLFSFSSDFFFFFCFFYYCFFSLYSLFLFFDILIDIYLLYDDCIEFYPDIEF